MMKGLKRPTRELATQTFVKMTAAATDCEGMPPTPPPTPPPEEEEEAAVDQRKAGKGGRRSTAPPGAIEKAAAEGKAKGGRMSTVGDKKKK
jgi:hypothetical protein